MHISRRLLVAGMVVCMSGCGGSDASSQPPADDANRTVRERIAALSPAGNLGHRGTGTNRPGHALAENSIASFVAAIADGADGIELDVELTADGRLVIMHDDTFNRTTTCSGCVSDYSFDAVRQCRLIDGNGTVTNEPPGTLDEVFAAVRAPALVNIEMKAYGNACRTAATGPTQLAQHTVAEVRRLDVAERVILSSFDLDALAAAKRLAPDLYAGLLISGLRASNIATAIALKLDAIHSGGAFPFLTLPADQIRAAQAAGLQINTWTVNDVASIQTLLDDGVDSIITDEPALLRQVIREQ